MKLASWWLDELVNLTAAAGAAATIVVSAQTPAPPDAHRRFYSLGDFRLESGVVLPNAKIAYATFGTLNAQRDNAILIPSWYGSDHHGYGIVRLEGAISALTADDAFRDGRYTSPPLKGLAAWSRHWAGWVWSQEWWRRELFKPQWATVDEVLASRTARDAAHPNNLIAQARTWQRHNVGDTPGFNSDHERA